MDTYIAYFDETGDDGANTLSSDFFVLTSIYMSVADWQKKKQVHKNMDLSFIQNKTTTYGASAVSVVHLYDT